MATKSDATPAGLAGKPPSDAAAAKKTAKPRARKTQVQKRGDQAPEAKDSTKAKSAAAEKMFKDADHAALVGLPPDMTHEQNENRIRKAALGY
jgi:hypothetical protein